MTTKVRPWEEVSDVIAGSESYDADTIAYDIKQKDGSRKNLAGIVAPRPISQMTIGEVNDWQEAEMRSKSRAYGLTLPERQAELRRQGFKDDPGSTGVGRFQFERSTLIDTAKSLYGDKYRDVVFDADVQNKLGKHLYDKVAARGPEALGNTWHVLRDPKVTTGAKPPAGSVDPMAAISGLGLTTAGIGAVASGLSGDGQTVAPDPDVERRPIGTLSQWSDPRLLYSVRRSKLRNIDADLPPNQRRPERSDQPSSANRAIRAAQRVIQRTKSAAETKKASKAKRVPMVARLQRVDGKLKRVMVPQKTIAENTVGFKELRQRIYEQIIINEQSEKDQ